jgi:LysM domain
MKRTIISLLALALVASCVTPPPAPPSEPVPPPAPPALPAETPPPVPPAPPLPSVATPESLARAKSLADDAFRLLLNGDENRARPLLEEAQRLDPAPTSTAACLWRGITVDPIEVLGRISTSYRVGPGETIISIAQRVFSDTCGFYMLARYNNISVPRLLRAGQTIRIPGKATLQPLPRPPETTAEPPLAPAPELPLGKPPAPIAKPPTETGPAGSTGPDAAVRQQIVERRYRLGVEAMQRQDLRTAISEFRAVLELEPGHSLARTHLNTALERQKLLGQ